MTSFLHRILGLAGGLSLVVSLSLAPVSAAYAQTPQGSGTGFGKVLQNGLDKAAPVELKGNTEPSVIVGNVLSAALGLLGVVLFGYLLYGGYLWMTAGGDDGQVKSAKSVIRNAVIGLIIIVLAYTIASFVISNLGNALQGGSSTSGSNSPPQ